MTHSDWPQPAPNIPPEDPQAGYPGCAYFLHLWWKNFAHLQLQKLQAVPAKLEHWENWLGLIFPAWLSLNIGFWIVFLPRRHWASWSWRGRSELLLVGLFWLLLDVPYLWRLSLVARHNHRPFAFQVAVGAKTPPLLLRPLVALWWLGHFAIPFWLVAMLARAPISGERGIADTKGRFPLPPRHARPSPRRAGHGRSVWSPCSRHRLGDHHEVLEAAQLNPVRAGMQPFPIVRVAHRVIVAIGRDDVPSARFRHCATARLRMFVVRL